MLRCEVICNYQFCRKTKDSNHPVGYCPSCSSIDVTNIDRVEQARIAGELEKQKDYHVDRN
ncbi:hypothetical protein KAR91_53565 [Candidatus Pacearchaeota archaeon]|nr:hypothetical protein [Candidatus Pacearchaeota archaeon]